ncbi:MAG TPA: hypothetical protein VGD08_23960 [Stellaceae bacterium]
MAMNGETGRMLRGNRHGRLQFNPAQAAAMLAMFAVLSGAAAGCATAPTPSEAPVTPAAGRDGAAFFEALRGQGIGAVFAALGQPAGVRPVAASAGAYIVAWQRAWVVQDSDNASARGACIVQGAVTRAGVVSDIFVEGDVTLCARSFRRGS